VQASATVPIEQLEAPKAEAKAPLTVAPRRSIHDPQDIAPVPPPALASATPPAARRPASQPRQVAKKTAAPKQAKPKARQPVVEETAEDEVVLAVSKPRRPAQPKRAAKVQVASAQADEAEVDEDMPETELMPVAKLPKKTIASKGPQWRAAGSSFVAEKPAQVAMASGDEPEHTSRVQAVRWEKPARPAPAASIEEAVFEAEEAGEESADAGDAEAIEEDTAEMQPASRVRIVGLSNG
jgi:hypothetical protein